MFNQRIKTLHLVLAVVCALFCSIGSAEEWDCEGYLVPTGVLTAEEQESIFQAAQIYELVPTVTATDDSTILSLVSSEVPNIQWFAGAAMHSSTQVQLSEKLNADSANALAEKALDLTKSVLQTPRELSLSMDIVEIQARPRIRTGLISPVDVDPKGVDDPNVETPAPKSFLAVFKVTLPEGEQADPSEAVRLNIAFYKNLQQLINQQKTQESSP